MNFLEKYFEFSELGGFQRITTIPQFKQRIQTYLDKLDNTNIKSIIKFISMVCYVVENWLDLPTCRQYCEISEYLQSIIDELIMEEY